MEMSVIFQSYNKIHIDELDRFSSYLKLPEKIDLFKQQNIFYNEQKSNDSSQLVAIGVNIRCQYNVSFKRKLNSTA